jgi:lycopene cyclase CruA
VFTGFGSLIRNLPRLTELLHLALTHDLLKAHHLNQVRAFQSNVAVTWLFSKGMMVPTGAAIAPARINSMLNTFFGILAGESPDVAERFIKDQATWAEFNRMALTAATHNPAMLIWIFELAGFQDLCRWGLTYLNYTLQTFLSWVLSWLTTWLPRNRSWLESLSPSFFLRLLALNYHFTYGMGQPPASSPLKIQTLDTLVSTPPPVPDRPNTAKPKSTKVPTG